MQKRTTTILLILSLAFNLAFIGSLGYKLWQKNRAANTRAPRLDRRNEEPSERMNFRPEDREQIDRIREMFEPKINEIQDELMEKRRVLGQLLMEEHAEEHPDTLLIYKQIDEIGKLQTELEIEVTRQILMARTVLDSTQERQFFRIVGRRMGSDFPDIRPPRQNNQNDRPE